MSGPMSSVTSAPSGWRALCGRASVVLGASVIAAGVAAVLGFVLGTSIDPRHVSLAATQDLLSLTYLLAPIAMSHGVLTSLLDRAAARAPRARAPLAAFRAPNPWLTGVSRALLLGLPAAVLARLLAAALCPAGASPALVALLLAAGAAPLAALVATSVTGPASAHALEVPQPRYRGSLLRYLLARHVVPVGLFNAVVSLAAAFALFPGPVRGPFTGESVLAPRALVLSDAVATFALVAVFVGMGTVTHARGDALSGLAPKAPPGSTPSVARLVASLCLAALTCSAATWLALGRTEGLSLPGFMIWRTLAFGAFAALVALLAARWTLARAGGSAPRDL